LRYSPRGDVTRQPGISNRGGGAAPVCSHAMRKGIILAGGTGTRLHYGQYLLALLRE
jgi:hypothetical protein